MVFIIIIVLSLIATYLLITSGVIKDLKWFKKNEDEVDEVYEIEELLPGMLGSAPSDDIDVYDARKPITIPMEGAINTLIESFKDNANTVYKDFKENRNSAKYKEYIFDDYKLELLRRNDTLSEEQLNKYFTIRNTVVKDINDLFTYYLDKVKYSEDRSYFTLRREILNSTGTGLILSEQNLDAIANYVLSNTKIPGAIILLIKYKVSAPAQELLDQIVMLAGYNYTTVLETLEQVLIREPLPGLSILGVVNSSSSITSSGVTTVRQGFWTQVFYIFKSNNIDNFLIALIRLSFMTEQVYRAILATVVSNLRKPKLTEAMNVMVKMCRESPSRLIKTFPYNFTHALIVDAINENRFMLRANKSINIEQVDRENEGISNIEFYSNLESNFPVIVQNIAVGVSNENREFNYENPFYPILSDDYMVNNYLSFPNIRHRGVLLDRTSAVTAGNSGYIMITNIASVDLTIGGIIIYATLQNGFITDDYRDISLTVADTNIVNNQAVITIESGRYTAPASWTDANIEPTTNWLSGSNITIPAAKSIRIMATKQTPVTGGGIRYVRIFAVLIPFVTKPISDFLKVSIVHDKNETNRFNHYQFINIPKDMPNVLITFDSVYSIANPANAVADTFKIFNDNLTTGTHTRSSVTTVSGNILTLSTTTGQAAASLFTVSSGVASITSGLTLTSVRGLITDSRLFHASDPNKGKSAYRIRIKNTNTNPSPIIIKKIIVFGNTSSDPLTFGTDIPLAGYIADENILFRDTQITAFTMNTAETAIETTGLTNIIVDFNNQSIPIDNSFTLDSGKSLFIEPTTALTTFSSSRYVCMRAMYIEFSGSNLTNLTFSIIKLNQDGNNKIATNASNANLWGDSALFMVFNTIDGASAYSPFSILPNYKQDNFSTLPNYMESKFQSDYYDQYYNPVSELVQYPSNFY